MIIQNILHNIFQNYFHISLNLKLLIGKLNMDKSNTNYTNSHTADISIQNFTT